METREFWDEAIQDEASVYHHYGVDPKSEQIKLVQEASTMKNRLILAWLVVLVPLVIGGVAYAQEGYYGEQLYETCQGWRVEMTEWIDGVPQTPTILGQGTWTDPAVIEHAPKIEGIDPDGDYWAFFPVEPGYCVFTYRYSLTNGCGNWQIAQYTYFGGQPTNNGIPTAYWNGLWTDPFTLETYTFTPPTPPESTTLFFANPFTEEWSCLFHHGVTIDCNGASAWWSKDGPAGTPNLVPPTQYAYIAWTNPFALETGTIPAFTIPFGGGFGYPQIPAFGVSEPSTCLIVRHVVELTTTSDCQGWTHNLFVDGYSSGGFAGSWTDPFTIEQTTFNYGVQENPGEVYDYFLNGQPSTAAMLTGTLNEPEHCLLPHGVQIGRDVDCVGARGWYALDDGDPIIYDTIVWADQYEIEQAFLAPYDIELPWGGTAHIDGFQVNEPTDCLVACELTPLYHMFVLRDYDAPAGYLQGGTCYVISDTIPSVERQAAICTYPFSGTGWTFQADRIPYGGYVYRDCHGNIIYGWPDWQPEWYLPEYAR
jgi:hypothetical protein